jgi:rSAM/selenodomain-associated transferase 2
MTPRFSVLIPTLNEAAQIAPTLASARSAFGRDAEYIVSDGGSSDATVAIAQSAGARIIAGKRGRGRQLDAALRAARGDVCVLLHADTLLPPNAGTHIEQTIRIGVGGAFLLRFDEARLRWLACAINLRARVFTSATGDQAIFARRDILLAIGGIPRVELFEDVRLWKQLKRAGRVQLVRAEVTTSARLWLKLGTWRGIFLHLRLRALHSLGVPPRRLARFYPTSGS